MSSPEFIYLKKAFFFKNNLFKKSTVLILLSIFLLFKLEIIYSNFYCCAVFVGEISAIYLRHIWTLMWLLYFFEMSFLLYKES